MKLQIVKQTNEQECGVCVLTSLHNFYYKHEQLKKEQALDESQISQNGMSIMDFEVLGNKMGLECESYDVNWTEFLNLKINNYFVLLLSTSNSSNHFVIARKLKKGLEIFDSCAKEMRTYNFDQIKNMFIGIIILVNKKPGKLFNKTFGKARTLLLFDAKFVLLNLCLSLLILLTSVAGASFLNWIIDLAISKSSINNLITISFTFLLVYILNNLFSYISSLYSNKQTKNYLLLFTSKILNSLQRKSKDFLNKVDKNWIYKIDECVYKISNFCVIQINKFLTNIIFCFICICIIGSINYWLLIFCVLFTVIEVIFFIFNYKKKKEVFLPLLRIENKNTIYFKQLIHCLNNEIWQTKKNNLIQRIKHNYGTIYKHFSDITLFTNNAILFKSIFKCFIEIALVVTMSYFVITTNNQTIGNLTFIVACFSLFSTSINDICDYFLSKLEFDVYWQVYKDISTVSNLPETNKIDLIDDVKIISFNTNRKSFTFLNTKINKLNHLSMHDIISNASSISINKKEINTLKNIIQNKIILIDENTKADIQNFLSNIENNMLIFSQYIQYFKLEIWKQTFTFKNEIIINLLSLLLEQNKIIFIDNILHFFNEQDRVVVKQIINKIGKNNFVFEVRREEND